MSFFTHQRFLREISRKQNNIDIQIDEIVTCEFKIKSQQQNLDQTRDYYPKNRERVEIMLCNLLGFHFGSYNS